LITEEIIQNFFEGKCDARDAAIVHAWLHENPAKLKEYMGEEEWKDFQPPVVLSPELSGKLWQSIAKTGTSRSARHLYFRWISVAASVILVVGLSWQFISQRQRARNITNDTPQKMALTLIDGSRVELSPNSKLSYPGNFNSAKRDVILNGEANFNIARDVARPFSVYSNQILITVLGTRFTVNSYQAERATKVILHDGKVRVKIPKHEYTLVPGDIFVVKKELSGDSMTARILHLEREGDDRFVFANYPLDVVFDQLQIIYNTKIIYNKEELGNRTFIGKIDKKDPLHHILNSIVLLNKFGLRKEGDSYIIGARPN
jgi:ferric-dicitrate binding protein FerR (iron transport regulator)